MRSEITLTSKIATLYRCKDLEYSETYNKKISVDCFTLVIVANL